MDAIDRLRLRLDWAYAHLDKLKVEVETFEAAKPYETREHRYTEGEYEVLELRLDIRLEPPPELALIAGDFVHTLRSLLDHIAWELGQKNAKLEQPRNIAFPIFLKATGCEPSFDISGQRMICELPANTHNAFRGLQPYTRTDRLTEHPLWILNELWNWDKHRSIIPLVRYSTAPRFPVLWPSGIVADIDTESPPYDNGAVVARLHLRRPPDIVFRYKCEITTKIVFGEPRVVANLDILSTLRDVYSFVEDEVLPAFEGFLA